MSADDLPQVTMGMGEREARELAYRGFPPAVMDQLWLRSVLICQRRHIDLGSRELYDWRCDRILAAVRTAADAAPDAPKTPQEIPRPGGDAA